MIHIDEKARIQIRELMRQLYRDSLIPDLDLIRTKAIHTYIIQKGGQPGFDVVETADINKNEALDE